jgi:hypothetical protein
VSQQVGDRLAGASPRDERPVGDQLRLAQGPLELQVQVEAPQAERVRQQQLGIQARRRGTVGGEVARRTPQDLQEPQLLGLTGRRVRR